MLKLIGAIIYTIRPSATLGACALVTAAYLPYSSYPQTLVILILCTFFGSSYCFILNDIFDREKDLLNKKLRPIATGVLPLRMAKGGAIVLAALFLISAYSFGYVVFALAILFILLATFYSKINVQSGLLANVAVAFIVAGTQWGVLFIKPDPHLIPAAIFLFFFTLPRELLLDWLDMDGDEAFGKDSLPIRLSKTSFSWVVVSCLIMATITIGYLLYFQISGRLSTIALILTGLSVWMSFARFLQNADRKNILFSVRFSHLTYALFIVAMLFR